MVVVVVVASDGRACWTEANTNNIIACRITIGFKLKWFEWPELTERVVKEQSKYVGGGVGSCA